MFVGWSCGSAVHGALEYARDLGPDDVMVIILPDHGTRYLGKVYNDNWMKDHGFLEERDFATAERIRTQGLLQGLQVLVLQEEEGEQEGLQKVQEIPPQGQIASPRK